MRILLWIGLFLLVGRVTTTDAQNISFELGSTEPYLGINSYDGATTGGFLSLVLVREWGTKPSVPNWKISVELTGDILATDGSGTVFPADKISFIPVNTQGQPAPLPTVSQIGMPSPVPLNRTGKVFLVPNSQVPLSDTQEYYRLEMNFRLSAAPGAYLKNLQEGYNTRSYHAPLQFKVRDGNNQLIGIINYTYNNIQVHYLQGPPPEEKEYSIRISTEAANGVLEFKHLADYVNGKSVVYSNGLTVTSNTDYQVTVRALSPEFSSSSANKLPLDVVKLELQQGVGDKFPVSLSQTAQPIVKGPTTNSAPVSFDIRYYTIGDDRRLFLAKPDNYSVPLTYEIVPR
ncbi:hypothetical protein [Limibacterium fermenti]|uniref:hypothetical protein n=1 Tax=Limibacterium fermenti TaxID=3229863 RepID=UPI003A698868